MRTIPYDNETLLTVINPYLWQMELVALNSGVNEWGYKEKCMNHRNMGMEGCVEYPNWDAFYRIFGPPDRYNMVVNFHFEIHKDHSDCPRCNGRKLHPDVIIESDKRSMRSDKYEITQAVLEEYVKYGKIVTANFGRLYWSEEENAFKSFMEGKEEVRYKKEEVKYPPLADVNWELNHRGHNDKWIGPLETFKWEDILAVERRLKGLPIECPHCQGLGQIYTGEPVVRLTLWYTHPNYGASKAVRINEIKQDDISLIKVFILIANKWLWKKFDPILSLNETNLEHIKSVPGRWLDHRQQTSRGGPLDSKLHPHNSV